MKDSKCTLVWTLTSLRIILALIFAYLFINGLKIEAIIIFLSAILTDGLDGYLARKFKRTSKSGAYLDILADFFLVLVAFGSFIFMGIYPLWLLILIVLVFLQFLITSRFNILVYDPIGKYYGSFLFLMILFTLLFAEFINIYVLLILIVIFTFITLISRYIFFIFKKTQKK